MSTKKTKAPDKTATTLALNPQTLPIKIRDIIEESLIELYEPPGSSARKTITRDQFDEWLKSSDVFRRSANLGKSAHKSPGSLRIKGEYAGLTYSPNSIKKEIRVLITVTNSPHNAGLLAQLLGGVSICGEAADDQGDLESGYVNDPSKPDLPGVNDTNTETKDDGVDSSDDSKGGVAWYLNPLLANGYIFGEGEVLNSTREESRCDLARTQGYAAKIDALKAKDNPYTKATEKPEKKAWAAGFKASPKTDWWLDVKCPLNSSEQGQQAYVNGLENPKDNPYSSYINELAKRDKEPDAATTACENGWSEGFEREKKICIARADEIKADDKIVNLSDKKKEKAAKGSGKKGTNN
jgi:hypothetical protein